VLRASMDVCHFRGLQPPLFFIGLYTLYAVLPRGGVIVILLSVAKTPPMLFDSFPQRPPQRRRLASRRVMDPSMKGFSAI